MARFFLGLLAPLLLLGGAARAQSIPNLPVAGSVSSTDPLAVWHAGGTKQATAAQLVSGGLGTAPGAFGLDVLASTTQSGAQALLGLGSAAYQPTTAFDAAGVGTNSSNQVSGTLPSGRLTGAYSGLTLSSSQVTGGLGYTPPTPTGSGASGTWGISITGNSATATTASAAPISGLTGTGTGVLTAAANPVNTAGGLVTYGGSAGALSVATAPQGTNAVQAASTAFVSQHSPCVQINDYGADPTGATDSTSAFNSAVSAQNSNQGICVSAGPGLYKFNSTLSYNFTSSTKAFTLIGQGSNVTTFNFPSTNAVSINMNASDQAVHVRGITFTTGGSGLNGVNVSQTGAAPASLRTYSNDFTDLNFHGANGYADGEYWGGAVILNSVSEVYFINDNFTGGSQNPGTGQGITLNSTVSNPGVVYNIINCSFQYNNVGIVYGTAIQGVVVSSSNFLADQYGIETVGSNQDQLNVSNSQFEEAVADILVDSFVPGVNINNNLFGLGISGFSPTVVYAVEMAQSGLTVITGNTCQPHSGSTGYCFYLSNNNNSWPSTIDDNTILGDNYGIYLDTSSGYVTVGTGNSYAANAVNVFNGGTTNIVPVGSCSGTPSSSYTVSNGIITHC